MGGTPAGLGGDRHDPAIAEADDGLVEQCELAVLECGAQPGGQLRLPYDVLLHLGRVQLDAALSGRLGPVHREVGVAQQLARPQARFGEADADGRGDADIVAADGVRLGELDPQPVGELQDLLFARVPVAAAVAHDERRELVAAEAGGGVALPHRVLESAGGLDEELIAGLVPDRVVDGLEAVEVDEEDGRAAQRGAAVGGATAGQGLLDAPGEQRAVGQVGERIVFGVVLELRLEPDPLGHVTAVEDEAAVVSVDGGLHIEPTVVAGLEAALDAGGGLLQVAGGQEAAHLVHHAAEVLGVDEEASSEPTRSSALRP